MNKRPWEEIICPRAVMPRVYQMCIITALRSILTAGAVPAESFRVQDKTGLTICGQAILFGERLRFNKRCRSSLLPDYREPESHRRNASIHLNGLIS